MLKASQSLYDFRFSEGHWHDACEREHRNRPKTLAGVCRLRDEIGGENVPAIMAALQLVTCARSVVDCLRNRNRRRSTDA